MLKFVGSINLILIISCLINIQGLEPLCVFLFFSISFDVGLHSDVYIPISFKLSMLIETAELYNLIPVWMTLIFIQVCEKSQTCVFIFLQSLLLI